MTGKHLVPKPGRARAHLPVSEAWFDPFRDFQRRMNHMFADFFSGYPLMPRWSEQGLMPAGFHPRVNVSETDKELKISAELPGLAEKDITVEIGDAAMTIHGERKEEKEEKGKNWHTREQSYGSFRRVIPLPANVDVSKAAAKFKKGLLSVILPKVAGAQPRKRTVKIEAE